MGDHGGKGGPDGQERRGEVALDDPPPFFRLDLFGGPRSAVAAGEGGEQLDRAELFGRVGVGVGQRVGVGGLSGRGDRPAAVGPDAGHDPIDRRFVATADAD